MRTVRVPAATDVDAALGVVRAHLAVTPVVPSPLLGPDVVLKLETLQPTGSFKVRGALAAMAAARERDPTQRVVAASAGNHGLGVAFAAARLGTTATVVVPANGSPAKLEAIERFGVTLVKHGTSYDDAEAHAIELSAAGGERAVFVSGYNDPDVIAGQGTIALELLDQVPRLDLILAPIGGGGLISGIALGVSGPRAVRIIGVEAAASTAMRAALDAGRIVTIEPGPTLADGLAGNFEPGSVTVDIVRRHVEDVVNVTEDEIVAAMQFLVTEHGLVVEASGAVGVAALLAGRVAPSRGTTAVVLTGRNISLDVLRKVLGGPSTR